jgi:hypothetical protein
MAKHRFPIRVRAAREGIKSGRRLAITGAVVLAMGAAGAGIAMADTGSPAAKPTSTTIQASTSVSDHPDTTDASGSACNTNLTPNGPVWALDSYSSTLTAVPAKTAGQWMVTIQDKGSFAGFADPNTCVALKSNGSFLFLYTVTVTSTNTPNPADLHRSYSGDVSTSQMVADFFGGIDTSAVQGGDYFAVYQDGNYVQNGTGTYGDVVASH